MLATNIHPAHPPRHVAAGKARFDERRVTKRSVSESSDPTDEHHGAAQRPQFVTQQTGYEVAPFWPLTYPNRTSMVSTHSESDGVRCVRRVTRDSHLASGRRPATDFGLRRPLPFPDDHDSPRREVTDVPARHPHRSALVAGISAIGIAAAGCGRVADERVSTVSLESVFELVHSARLTFPTDDPPGAELIVAWDGAYHIADPTARNVKQFSADGALRRVVGRAGDGPGEFRQPLAIAPMRDGGVAVYDGAHQHVSLFTAEGRFLRTWEPSLIGPGTIQRMDERLLVTGRIAGLDSMGGAGLGKLVHVVDPSGTVVRSMAFPGEAPGLAERALMFPHAASLGGERIAALSSTRPVVALFDVGAAEPRLVPIRSPLYREPVWPAEQDDIGAIVAWARDQTWLSGLLAGPNGSFVVGILRPVDEDTVLYHYVRFDGSGRRMAVTSETPQLLRPCGTSEVCSVSIDDRDQVEVRVYRVRN